MGLQKKIQEARDREREAMRECQRDRDTARELAKTLEHQREIERNVAQKRKVQKRQNVVQRIEMLEMAWAFDRFYAVCHSSQVHVVCACACTCVCVCVVCVLVCVHLCVCANTFRKTDRRKTDRQVLPLGTVSANKNLLFFTLAL